MKTLDLELPVDWAVALINSDETGLEDDDQAALDAFVDWMLSKYGKCWCVNVSDDESGNFKHYHDASEFGVLACDVATFTFDITPAYTRVVCRNKLTEV